MSTKIKSKFTSISQDNYTYGMDWGGNKVSISDLSNYRQYHTIWLEPISNWLVIPPKRSDG